MYEPIPHKCLNCGYAAPLGSFMLEPGQCEAYDLDPTRLVCPLCMSHRVVDDRSATMSSEPAEIVAWAFAFTLAFGVVVAIAGLVVSTITSVRDVDKTPAARP